MESFEKKQHAEIPAVADYEEACEFIEDLYERGERPVVTVPQEYASYLAEGLRAHTSWVNKILAATFGRDPYLPSETAEPGGRLVVRVKNILINQIKPRMTGPHKLFQGVVALSGPIPPDAIEVVEK